MLKLESFVGFRRFGRQQRLNEWRQVWYWVSLVCLSVSKVSTKTISQCFQSSGRSFVTLYCGYQHIIDITRAVHGRRRQPLSDYCEILPTDCLTDVTGQYDWSVCRGQRHCVHSLRQFTGTDLPCADDTGQRPVYLQVSLTHSHAPWLWYF